MTETAQPRWARYARIGWIGMRPYVEGEILSEHVSVSVSDREAGSPKAGDMIARNPANDDDQWLIAADYFAKNYRRNATDLGSASDHRWPRRTASNGGRSAETAQV